MGSTFNQFFVSYSHKDKKWADELFKNVIQTTRGICAHSIDFQHLVPGDDFDLVLRQKIDDASAFVLLVSRNFLRSDYVRNKEWKWIREKGAAARICCIEIGKAVSDTLPESESELLAYLKEIHRDTGARLPLALPKSAAATNRHVAAVHRSIARMLDPEGVKVVERLEARNFRNIEWLADGKLANVYSAKTPTMGRKLAVKVPRSGSSEEFLKSMHNTEEISAIPNFVRTLEIDTANEPFYCITEFIEGSTLADMLEEKAREGRLIPLQVPSYVLLKLCLAMKAVYARGMSHLNIRPKNILIDAHNEPYLLPTSRVRDTVERRWQRSTSEGMDLETAIYALPEQTSGENWRDESADIYSLGVIGYWMIAGHPPALMANREELASNPQLKPVFAGPPDLLNARPDCPVSLAHTVMRMLNPQPAVRYRSFDEVLAGLMRCPASELAVVELSWRRCLNGQQDIFTPFYERFFAAAGPAVEAQFAKPWPTPRQKNLLLDAVIHLFQYADLKRCYRDVPVSLNPLEGSAHQHARRNIRSAHFLAFRDALIETVAVLDPAVNRLVGNDDPIRQAWTVVLEPGTRFLAARVAELTHTADS